MKKFIIVAAVVFAAGCSTAPHERVVQQVETSSLQSNSFCKGDELKSYIETDYYYQFTCSNGRFFMLPKK